MGNRYQFFSLTRGGLQSSSVRPEGPGCGRFVSILFGEAILCKPKRNSGNLEVLVF